MKMSRRIIIILFSISIRIILFSDDTQARSLILDERLKTVKMYYEKGDLGNAEYYLEQIRGAHAAETETDPEYYRLRGLIQAAHRDLYPAERDFIKSLQYKESPFLYYILANRRMDSRSMEEAEFFFRKTVRSFLEQYDDRADSGNPDQENPERKLMQYALVYYYCPLDENEMIEQTIPDHPLTDSRFYPILAGDTLTLMDAAHALEVLLVLEKHEGGIRPETAGWSRTIENHLKKAGMDGIRFFLTPPGPGERESCIGRLLSKKQKSDNNIKYYNKHIRRVHEMNLMLSDDIRSLYAFGSYLTYGDDPYPLHAVHLLRRAMELTGFYGLYFIHPPGDFGETEEILRTLGDAYERMGKDKDGEAMHQMAGAIKDYRILNETTGHEEKPTESEDYKKMKTRIFQIATSHLHNRESLLVLMGYFQEIDKNRVQMYEEKLKKRDNKTDSTELPGVFKNYR